MKKFWPFAFYFFQYAGVAFMMPFLVLFYQGLGFDGGQIGFLAGISPLITLFSGPLVTGIADTTRQHKLVMGISLLIATLAVFTFPLFSIFAPILLIVLVNSFFTGPVSSLADNATMSMLAGEKDMYGRLRLGGTIGFALAAPISGQLVQTYGIKMAFWGCGLMYLLAFVVSLNFEHTSNKAFLKQTNSLVDGLRVMIADPRWLLFLVGAFVGGFAMAVTNNYFFSYMKELGAKESTMGFALTLGTICEVPVMLFGNRLLRYFKAYPLFILALIISGVRLLLFSIASSPNQAMFFNLLNGLTFPVVWIAGVSYVDEHAPAGMSATAQGVFGAAVFGIGTSSGGFLGGALLDMIGAKGLCLVFGSVTLLVVAVILLFGRMLPQGRVQADLL